MRTKTASMRYNRSRLTVSTVFSRSSLVSFIIMFVIRIRRDFDSNFVLILKVSRSSIVINIFVFFSGSAECSILRSIRVPSFPNANDCNIRSISFRSSNPVACNNCGNDRHTLSDVNWINTKA